jgi:hypothetical protein
MFILAQFLKCNLLPPKKFLNFSQSICVFYFLEVEESLQHVSKFKRKEFLVHIPFLF